MKATPVTAGDHVVGPEGARVTLIEYGDFECPFCVRAFPVIEAVRESHRDSLRFVFRHVSRSSQGFEKQCAEMSEFAATLGKFWEMHREIFTHPGAHEPEQLIGYAKSIGLDPEAARQALTERQFAPRVRDIAAEAAHNGIVGTPILFLNGERYEDRVELEPLDAAVDKLIW